MSFAVDPAFDRFRSVPEFEEDLPPDEVPFFEGLGEKQCFFFGGSRGDFKVVGGNDDIAFFWPLDLRVGLGRLFGPESPGGDLPVVVPFFVSEDGPDGFEIGVEVQGFVEGLEGECAGSGGGCFFCEFKNADCVDAPRGHQFGLPGLGGDGGLGGIRIGRRWRREGCFLGEENVLPIGVAIPAPIEGGGGFRFHAIFAAPSCDFGQFFSKRGFEGQAFGSPIYQGRRRSRWLRSGRFLGSGFLGSGFLSEHRMREQGDAKNRNDVESIQSQITFSLISWECLPCSSPLPLGLVDLFESGFESFEG